MGVTMWHHKTKIGTFWIVESEDKQEFYLGFNEDSLGKYDKLEDAIADIMAHETGDLKWDMSNITQIPETITDWDEGEPENWEELG